MNLAERSVLHFQIMRRPSAPADDVTRLLFRGRRRHRQTAARQQLPRFGELGAWLLPVRHRRILAV